MSEVLGRAVRNTAGNTLKAWRCAVVAPVRPMSRTMRRRNGRGKKLPAAVAALKAAYPDAQVRLWAEDKHRIGLYPVNRMVWVPLGETPIDPVNLKTGIRGYFMK